VGLYPLFNWPAMPGDEYCLQARAGDEVGLIRMGMELVVETLMHGQVCIYYMVKMSRG
jgi:hypothetical protein